MHSSGLRLKPERIPADIHKSGIDQESLGFALKVSGFGSESVRTHALTPKSGIISQPFLKNLNQLCTKQAFYDLTNSKGEAFLPAFSLPHQRETPGSGGKNACRVVLQLCVQ
jgi:hypothetical protein